MVKELLRALAGLAISTDLLEPMEPLSSTTEARITRSFRDRLETMVDMTLVRQWEHRAHLPYCP